MPSLSFRAMGSQVNVWHDGEDNMAVIPQQIEAIEARLSRFRPQSELSQLNQQLGQWVAISDVLHANIAQALRAAHTTNGLVTPLVLRALILAGYDRDFSSIQPTTFDGPIHLHDWRDIQLEPGRVWIPDEIDLGGTAKGWTAQDIAEKFGSVLVDMGGDIVARGKPWQVHIADPLQPQLPFASVILEDQAIATSGTDYRRWGEGKHHIIDPRTARPAQTDVLSATVIHPDAVLAEAFAKAVLLQGSQAGLAWLSTQPDAAGLVYCHDGSVLATEDFRQFIIEGV